VKIKVKKCVDKKINGKPWAYSGTTCVMFKRWCWGYGNKPGDGGKTAKEMCCSCGGGAEGKTG